MRLTPIFALAASLFLFSCSSNILLPTEPTGLRVDYIRTPEPTFIFSSAPNFSWLLAPGVQSQTAYQIIISSSEKCKVGDVWDSGKILSSNNFAVSYAGSTLQESQNYFWKIRYWDAEDKPTNYSAAQSFTMASAEQKSQSIVTSNPLLRRADNPREMDKIGDGEYQFDFGKAAFGALDFSLDVVEDAVITVRIGEQLTSEGLLEREPQGTIRYQEVEVELKKGVTDYSVQLLKDERNTGHMAIPVPEEWGVILPFRHVEISGGGDNPIETIRLKRDVMYGYREELGRFNSSDPKLDSIWEICRYTIQATDFLGYYIDGDRERIPYEADAYLNQLSHYCIDSEYAIGKKSLEYFMSHATWPTEWLLHTIMIAYQDYLYTGDKRLVEQYYQTIKAKSLYELVRADGLISAKSEVATSDYLRKIGFKAGFKHMEDIVDWPKASFTKGGNELGERDGHEMLAINTVVNCFYFNALTQLSELAQVIGNQSDAEFFANEATKVRSAINEKLFDPEKGIYIDGEGSTHSSLHSNMMALAFDVVDDQYKSSVAEFVKSRGMACSVYGAQYLFEALYKAGEAEYALELMTNDTDRGWLNMIRVGSTMTLEAWDIKYKGNLDWNHAWGAAPANLIPRHMWGITPTSAGYTSASIKPQLAGLEYSEISVPTLQGVIHALYSLEAGEKHYTLTIPSNMEATFCVVDQATRITLNGEECDRVVKLKVGENQIVVKLE